MKKLRFLVFALVLCAPVLSFAQASSTNKYVVVGAFRVLDNAQRYTERANRMNFHAQYALNSANNLYYVYLLQTTDNKQALAFMMKMRLETEFKEAWVFRGSLGVEIPVTATEPTIEPKKDEPVVVKEEVKEEPPVVKEEPVVIKDEPVVVKEEPKVDSSAIKADIPKPAGKPFIFKMENSETGNPLVGEVHIFEGGGTQYQSFPVNEVVYLLAPKSPTQVYQVVTLSAGYQEMRRTINYADPSASASEVNSNNEYVIALPLVRVKTGDYIEFSNVRFFQNSTILQPESKDELDALAMLLKENPKYKVAIHGHCNGTQDRNVIVRSPDGDFFSTNTSNQRKTVNDKEFTQLRADLVKEYLVSQGIDTKRIKTKGEGGRALIYPVNSTLSSRNDRVEVEVKKGR